MTLPDVTQSPVIVWVTIAVFAAVVIAQAVPKVLGPVGTALREWTASKQRATSEATDARLESLTEDVDYLRAEVTALRTEMQERDQLARAHTVWDHRLLVEIARLDPTILQRVGDPPSLYPHAH